MKVTQDSEFIEIEILTFVHVTVIEDIIVNQRDP